MAKIWIIMNVNHINWIIYMSVSKWHVYKDCARFRKVKLIFTPLELVFVRDHGFSGLLTGVSSFNFLVRPSSTCPPVYWDRNLTFLVESNLEKKKKIHVQFITLTPFGKFELASMNLDYIREVIKKFVDCLYKIKTP